MRLLQECVRLVAVVWARDCVAARGCSSARQPAASSLDVPLWRSCAACSCVSRRAPPVPGTSGARALVRAMHVISSVSVVCFSAPGQAWATSYCVHLHAWHEALRAPGYRACAYSATSQRDWWQRKLYSCAGPVASAHMPCAPLSAAVSASLSLPVYQKNELVVGDGQG